MSQKLSDLANGALVKDTSSTYYGEPIVWRVIDKNHTGYPDNSITLMTDKIIKIAGFDGAEEGNANSNRASMGNNRYRTSNIRQWLNSSGAANSWWTAQNLTDGTTNTNNHDASPTTANMENGNGYDTQAGFLATFSAEFKAALLDTTLTVAKNTVTDGGGSESITDKIFLASVTELRLANENSISEGNAFAYFTADSRRIAYVTAQAASNSDYKGVAAGQAWYWWLRTPNSGSAHCVREVLSTGGLNTYQITAHGGWRSVRPFCNLSSDTRISDSPDTDSAYQILWSQPPTTPEPITVPATILAGVQFSVTWGTSIDPENALAGYILERQLNGGTWVQAYTGMARSCNDIVAEGNVTAAYRVRAYDAVGWESDYVTSDTRTIVSNDPPTISGSDSDLGLQTGAFTQEYTATDTDNDAVITVVENIDSTQKRSYTAGSGEEQTFNVTDDDFIRLGNGSHTLQIVASDQYGAAATRTYTFSRSESQIEITLAAPLTVAAQPERIAMSISRQIPDGATLQALVCNNGNDESPVWEDATASITAGLIYYFTNTVKTAENWGVNVQVSVQRNSAVGDCYIASIGGNFD
jgi:hypothetical protein